jgi:pimeloyl-ACP methyl ester carboxylesterase
MLKLPIRYGVAAVLGAGLLVPPSAPAPAAAPADPWSFASGANAAAMTAAGAPYAGWAAAGRRFPLFDQRGDGRAVEVIGDPAAADRFVVLVPGVGARLADFDRGLGGVARRAPTVQARAVADAARDAAPHARVAVVAWLGYDPPEGLGLAAVRAERAERGAEALVGFVAALAAAWPAATVMVVGHSYGAVVVGLAAGRLDARVTDVVAIGAPGMGVGNAAELRTGARVWAGEAAGDWIRRVPGVRLLGLGHGRRPAGDGFGARRLPTAGVSGHDGYLVPGTASLAAVALIAVGRGAEVPR